MSLIFQKSSQSIPYSCCQGCLRSLFAPRCRYVSTSNSRSKNIPIKSFNSTFLSSPISRTVGLRFYSNKGPESIKTTDKYPWWHRLTIVGGVAALLYSMLKDADYTKELEEERIRYEELNVKTPLGGEWELIDDTGTKRSSREFKGHWMLVYFGFTHCPDICPEEMHKLTKIVNNIDRKRNLPNLQPIFISVDPDRDTPKVIKDYLKDFNTPRIVGFTAESEDKIREVTKKFRVYFGKGPKDEDNDYIIDHTIILYLVNCDGLFVNYYGRGLDATSVTESIEKHMDKYKELKRKRMM